LPFILSRAGVFSVKGWGVMSPVEGDRVDTASGRVCLAAVDDGCFVIFMLFMAWCDFAQENGG
jgi:hypothetical protein